MFVKNRHPTRVKQYHTIYKKASTLLPCSHVVAPHPKTGSVHYRETPPFYMFKTVFLLCLEILPLIVFFILGQYLPFLQAVLGYILATMVTIIMVWHFQKRISYLALIFGGVIIISGSLSIWLSNPNILQAADTIYYLFGSILIYVLSLLNINFLKILFNKTFAITELGWKILNRRWMIVLALAGISNEIVRQLGTEGDWLWFQLLRTILILMFATYQFTLSKHYRLPTASKWGVVITK